MAILNVDCRKKFIAESKIFREELHYALSGAIAILHEPRKRFVNVRVFFRKLYKLKTQPVDFESDTL